MEAGGGAAKQLKCYGRRNRPKSAAKVEVTSAPAVVDAGANGKLQVEEILVPDSVGQDKSLGDARASQESGANAGKGAQDDAGTEKKDKEEVCVVATEVLEEAPQQEFARFLTEEEELAYQEAVLNRADAIWSRQEALEQMKKRAPSKWKEPAHGKAHWDYVLEEMIWLSKDFDKERKWKLAQAKKVALKAAKAKSEEESKGVRRLKGEEQRIRRVASNIAKEVKKFWVKIEKLVDYKHQLAAEQKKKKALDKHLDFLLGQTES